MQVFLFCSFWHLLCRALFLVTHHHMSCHAVLLMSCTPLKLHSCYATHPIAVNPPGCAGFLLACMPTRCRRPWPAFPGKGQRVPSRSKAVSNVLPLWIHPIKPFHTLLIHRKHNRSTHHQPRQSRPHPTPKGQQSFLPPNQPRAPQRTPIQLLGLQTLHPRLDCIQRLCHQHRHQPRRSTDTKRRCGGELLAGRHVGLGGLAEEVVRAEAYGAVGGLAGGGGDKAGEEACDASLGVDDGDGVEEAAHAWDSAFAVVDSTGREREKE